MFQSTPLCEGRLFFRNLLSSALRFNPRPCVRGDLKLCKTAKTFIVSIHAPV